MKPFLFVFPILFAVVSTPQAASIDAANVFANWAQGDSPLNPASQNPDVTWTLMGDGVEEINNGSGGMISDFTTFGDVSFSVRVEPTAPVFADNDLWGIAFNFQDNDNHYRLGWGGGGYPDIGSGGTLVQGLYLVKESAGVGEVLFNDNSVFWQNNVEYDVSIAREGDELNFSVTSFAGDTTFGSGTIEDNEFTSGHVGIWVESQSTRFSNFYVTVVPEPSTIAICVVLGFLGFGAAMRRESR